MTFLDFRRNRFASWAAMPSWRAAIAVVLFATMIGAVAGTAQANSKFAAVAVDARTGKLLSSENADSIRHPASLTKMMTLYVLFQDLKSGKIKLDSPIRMSKRAASMAPSKLGVKAGTSITVETAIKALVVKSANDVASAVAENLGGTESEFARRMTRTARSIGMSKSTFANASGLPNAAQVTTARDMATLGLRLMRDFPQYYPYFRTQSFTHGGRTIRGHNRLLASYDGTDGIKTGYINASGFNLVSSVRRGDKRLVGVVLGGKTGASRDAYMKRMLTAHFPKGTNGKMIAALAGSSKGAIDPVGIEATKTAAATGEDKPSIFKRKKKEDETQAAPEIEVAEAPATVTEEGDTDDTKIIPGTEALAGSSIQTVEFPPAQAQQTPQAVEAPQVVESNLVDPSVPAKLPFKVKTPSEQLADQTTVASLPTEAAVDGGWTINIGDYATKKDAQARLQEMRKKATGILDGKTAQTAIVQKGETITYRARFSGFDEQTAKTACQQIKKKKSVCTIQGPA